MKITSEIVDNNVIIIISEYPTYEISYYNVFHFLEELKQFETVQYISIYLDDYDLSVQQVNENTVNIKLYDNDYNIIIEFNITIEQFNEFIRDYKIKVHRLMTKLVN